LAEPRRLRCSGLRDRSGSSAIKRLYGWLRLGKGQDGDAITAEDVFLVLVCRCYGAATADRDCHQNTDEMYYREEHNVGRGKNVLVIKGSLLSVKELEAALKEQGASVQTVSNVISAFSLIERERFDGAVIDKGLHNRGFDLCAAPGARFGTPFPISHLECGG
jgi:hypothetical protein